VFPYDRPGARWTAFRAIRAPLAVVVGGRDEFLDRSPEALIEAFAAQAGRADSFTGRIIPGALHGFQGREAAVARAVVEWIRDRRM
jgi:dienelactone hydrolase